MLTSAFDLVGKLPDGSKLVQLLAMAWHLEFGDLL